MRLTRAADYGARGTLYLARQPRDRIVLVGEIARAEGVPESYLAKIFQSLARAGLVRSHRGARGGFSLARPAAEITLRQIIEAVEGPLSLNRCLDPREGCECSPTCPMYAPLAAVQERLLAALDAITLDAMAAKESAAS